ncbi:MAG: MASE3 domain-containing protein, partial [Desulfobacterales bacterium]
VVYVATLGYLRNGSLILLLLAGGSLAFSIGSLLAGWTIGSPNGPNVAVTIHNSGAFLSAIFHFMGAALVFFGATSVVRPKHLKITMGCVFLGVLALIAFVVAMTLYDLFPSFFIQGEGPTPFRQMILGSTVFLFGMTPVLLMTFYFRSGADFLYWYSIALVFIAIGLSCIFFQRSVGSPIGWAGRAAQYLSGIYFLLAVLTAVKDVRTRGTALEESIADLFRHRLNPGTKTDRGAFQGQ